jgi:hypothetical protein
VADPNALAELDRDIALVRDNIRQLTEQAAAFSGARDEERAADRIADQEARLADLIKRRDALTKAAPSKPAPKASPAKPAAAKAAPPKGGPPNKAKR